MMAAKDRFDVHFERDYAPPAVGDWQADENTLAGPLEPYFLRCNTGPRWMLGGVMSRPFINALQSGGRFAISSIESSSRYPAPAALSRWLTFPTVDHCFCVLEGLLKVKLKGDDAWSSVREGQTLVISAGQAFTLEFASRYVRVWSFTNGKGIEELIQTAGKPCDTFVIPDQVQSVDAAAVDAACAELGVQTEPL
jgi:uncharacterized protein YaiE (UPF0345 family)